MRSIRSYIYFSKPSQSLMKWAKRVKLFNKELSLYLISAIFLKKLKDNEINMKASAVAFNFTLAIFPAIIFLFTLVPYLPIDNLQDEILMLLSDVSPDSIDGQLYATVNDIINKPREGLLSFGFITALFLATNGMIALMNAFDSCYRSDKKKRGFLKKRLIATFLTFILAFILFMTIVLLIVGRIILDALSEIELMNKFYINLLDILRYVAVILMFFISNSVIFYLAPSVHRRWKFFSIGSVIATGLSILVSVLFSFYLDNFGLYNKIYGSIGAMIGVMVWILAISNVLLIGFEVNTTIDTAKSHLKRLERKLEREMEASMGS